MVSTILQTQKRPPVGGPKKYTACSSGQRGEGEARGGRWIIKGRALEGLAGDGLEAVRLEPGSPGRGRGHGGADHRGNKGARAQALLGL